MKTWVRRVTQDVHYRHYPSEMPTPDSIHVCSRRGIVDDVVVGQGVEIRANVSDPVMRLRNGRFESRGYIGEDRWAKTD